MDDLKTVYVMHLKKLLSVENQIIEALPEMIQNSTNEGLRAGLSDHLEETRTQATRLEDILTSHDESPTPVEDVAFKTLLSEASKEISTITNPAVRDAVIVVSSQVVEHIEMARYGSMVEWAKALDLDDDVSHLKDTLSEEGGADKKLTAVAEGGFLKESVNKMAAE